MNVTMENSKNFITENPEVEFTIFNEIETSTKTTPEIIPDESERYILIPLVLLFVILILSALVYLMARNRKLPRYCKRKYKFDDKSDDSDSALLRNDDVDDPMQCLLNGKLQIQDHYETYQTTPHFYKDSNGELYS